MNEFDAPFAAIDSPFHDPTLAEWLLHVRQDWVFRPHTKTSYGLEDVRLCLSSVPARPGVRYATAEDVIDVLRGLIDSGVLHPDDVLRDTVLLNGVWRLRYWRRPPA